MTWNATAPFQRIVALLTALEEAPGVAWLGAVYTGVPRGVGTQVAAYVTLGGQTLNDWAFREQQREVTYMVTFVYGVANAEATAELGIIGAVDDFLEVLATETLNTPGSVLAGATVDPGLGDTAEYEPLVAQEFRRYPVRITLPQDRAYA